MKKLLTLCALFVCLGAGIVTYAATARGTNEVFNVGKGLTDYMTVSTNRYRVNITIVDTALTNTTVTAYTPASAGDQVIGKLLTTNTIWVATSAGDTNSWVVIYP
jgi:hypothetical protein